MSDTIGHTRPRECALAGGPCAAQGDPVLTGALRTLSGTAVGARHAEAGGVNQDAAVVRLVLGRPDVVVATVADGHGYPQHWRSDVGSRLGATMLAAELERIVDDAHGTSAAALEAQMSASVGGALVRAWREECGRHLREHPMVSADYTGMAAVLSAEELQHATLLPLLLYGSTARGFCLSSEWLLAGGVGDGEVVHVDQSGTAACTLPQAGPQFGNMTSSLCENDPTADWRAAVLPRTPGDAGPVLVLAATDGFTAAFAAPGALAAAAERLTGVLVTRGHEALERELWASIGEAQRCVGDDVTVVLAYDEAGVERLRSLRCPEARTAPVTWAAGSPVELTVPDSSICAPDPPLPRFPDGGR